MKKHLEDIDPHNLHQAIRMNGRSVGSFTSDPIRNPVNYMPPRGDATRPGILRLNPNLSKTQSSTIHPSSNHPNEMTQNVPRKGMFCSCHAEQMFSTRGLRQAPLSSECNSNFRPYLFFGERNCPSNMHMFGLPNNDYTPQYNYPQTSQTLKPGKELMSKVFDSNGKYFPQPTEYVHSGYPLGKKEYQIVKKGEPQLSNFPNSFGRNLSNATSEKGNKSMQSTPNHRYPHDVGHEEERKTERVEFCDPVENRGRCYDSWGLQQAFQHGGPGEKRGAQIVVHSPPTTDCLYGRTQNVEQIPRLDNNEGQYAPLQPKYSHSPTDWSLQSQIKNLGNKYANQPTSNYERFGRKKTITPQVKNTNGNDLPLPTDKILRSFPKEECFPNPNMCTSLTAVGVLPQSIEEHEMKPSFISHPTNRSPSNQINYSTVPFISYKVESEYSQSFSDNGLVNNDEKDLCLSRNTARGSIVSHQSNRDSARELLSNRGEVLPFCRSSNEDLKFSFGPLDNRRGEIPITPGRCSNHSTSLKSDSWHTNEESVKTNGSTTRVHSSSPEDKQNFESLSKQISSSSNSASRRIASSTSLIHRMKKNKKISSDQSLIKLPTRKQRSRNLSRPKQKLTPGSISNCIPMNEKSVTKSSHNLGSLENNRRREKLVPKSVLYPKMILDNGAQESLTYQSTTPEGNCAKKALINLDDVYNRHTFNMKIKNNDKIGEESIYFDNFKAIARVMNIVRSEDDHVHDTCCRSLNYKKNKDK